MEEELATRSRTRPSTVLRTSACDLGVGGSSGFVDFDEEVPRMFRPNQDEVEEELTGLRVELGPGVGVDRDKARTKGRFLSPTTGGARVTSSYDGGSSTGRKSTSFSLLGIIIGDVLYRCRGVSGMFLKILIYGEAVNTKREIWHSNCASAAWGH